MPVISTVRRSLALGRLGVAAVHARRQGPGPARAAARRLVAARLGALRGLPQKIGQLLSLVDLDDEQSAFAGLGESAIQEPARLSFAWIARELGAPLSTVYRHVDESAAAASIGQVHRGVLLTGEPVAIKVQYPGVRASLDADLAALGWLAAPLSAAGARFDLAAYRREMRRGLLLELDYRHEVAVLKRFAQHAAAVPGLVTPLPFEPFCSERLITMSWIEGDRVGVTRDWPAAARESAALVLLRTFLRGCFDWGQLHADPHAGNLRFARHGSDARVGLIDFGCTRVVSEIERDALRRLAEDGADLGAADLFDAYVGLGFDAERLAPMAGRLRAITAILFEPFHATRPFDAAAWRISARLAAALGDDRVNFRTAGPASMIFLIRAFQGLVRYVTTLGTKVDWREELLAIPRQPGATDAGMPPARGLLNGVTAMGTSVLRVQVNRNDELIASLRFPATVAGCLPDLVPPDMAEHIRAGGIDLAKLSAEVVARGYPPGDVVRIANGDRTVRVWLE